MVCMKCLRNADTFMQGYMMKCCFNVKIGHLGDLPKEVPTEVASNEDFLRKAHHVLLEVNTVTVSFASYLIENVRLR